MTAPRGRRRLGQVTLERLRELDAAADAEVCDLLEYAPPTSPLWSDWSVVKSLVDMVMFGITAKRHPLMAAERRWVYGAAFLTWVRERARMRK